MCVFRKLFKEDVIDTTCTAKKEHKKLINQMELNLPNEDISENNIKWGNCFNIKKL